MQTLPYGLNEKFLKKEFVKKLLLEGLDGGGGTNVSCQLKFRPFISCQLNFWPFVSCQLNDC